MTTITAEIETTEMKYPTLDICQLGQLDADFLLVCKAASTSAKVLKTHKISAGEILHKIRRVTPHGEWRSWQKNVRDRLLKELDAATAVRQ